MLLYCVKKRNKQVKRQRANYFRNDSFYCYEWMKMRNEHCLEWNGRTVVDKKDGKTFFFTLRYLRHFRSTSCCLQVKFFLLIQALCPRLFNNCIYTHTHDVGGIKWFFYFSFIFLNVKSIMSSLNEADYVCLMKST